MNASTSTSKLHIALILGAMTLGVAATRLVPAEAPDHALRMLNEASSSIRAARHGDPRDASRDLSGFDVDLHRLVAFAQIC